MLLSIAMTILYTEIKRKPVKSTHPRNALGVDEFLGQVNLPLQDYDVYEKPKTRCLSTLDIAKYNT